MGINWPSWLVWGFGATVILTGLLASSHGFGLTRMSLPYMLGTMVTENRDRAKFYGILIHLFNGWVFSLIYVAAFEAFGRSSWWLGSLIGLVHGLFVVTAVLPVLPAIHPRMASDQRGPTVVRYLEPPGFFGLNYGHRTPLMTIVAHVLFGLVLGLFYRVT